MGLNRAALDKLRSLVGNDDDFAELVASFLEEAPQLMKSLVASSAAGDLATLRRSAHSLKSNARDFGADELAEVCSRIELAIIRSGSPSPEDIAIVPSLLEVVENQLNET